MTHRRTAARGLALLAAALLASAAVSGWAVARSEDSDRAGSTEKGMSREQRLDHHMALMSKELKLTPQQESQMRTITNEERSQLEPLFKEMRETRRAIRLETEKGSFDEARVRSLAERQARVNVDLIVARARITSKMFAILTPEQRAHMREMHEHGRPDRSERHEDSDSD